MVAYPIVLHTKLTGRVRVRRTWLGRYVVQVEERAAMMQMQWPRGPEDRSGPHLPDTAAAYWRDACARDSWLLARKELI